MKVEFPLQIFEKYSTIFKMQIPSVGVEFFFHANRRTDMTKLVVAFRNFVNAPKMMNV
jgi:hypothetical protein